MGLIDRFWRRSRAARGIMGRCESLRAEVLAHLDARDRRAPNPEPAVRNNDALREAQNNHARYMMDTMTEYQKRFAPRVRELRDTLAASGVSDPELDRLVDHPANPRGAREAVTLLATLSRRLDPEVVALEKVFSGPAVDEE